MEWTSLNTTGRRKNRPGDNTLYYVTDNENYKKLDIKKSVEKRKQNTVIRLKNAKTVESSV